MSSIHQSCNNELWLNGKRDGKKTLTMGTGNCSQAKIHTYTAAIFTGHLKNAQNSSQHFFLLMIFLLSVWVGWSLWLVFIWPLKNLFVTIQSNQPKTVFVYRSYQHVHVVKIGIKLILFKKRNGWSKKKKNILPIESFVHIPLIVM